MDREVEVERGQGADGPEVGRPRALWGSEGGLWESGRGCCTTRAGRGVQLIEVPPIQEVFVPGWPGLALERSLSLLQFTSGSYSFYYTGVPMQ